MTLVARLIVHCKEHFLTVAGWTGGGAKEGILLIVVRQRNVGSCVGVAELVLGGLDVVEVVLLQKWPVLLVFEASDVRFHIKGLVRLLIFSRRIGDVTAMEKESNVRR